MKIFPTTKRVSLGIGMAAVALSASAAGAGWPGTKQADSGLPIEPIPSRSGSIVSFRAHETSDRLYVNGQAKPHQLTRPMHVDIQLIGADGRVVAEKRDDLDAAWHPRISSWRHGQQSYVASFPLSEARQAVKIRVAYHERHQGQRNE